jgi:hypothetical protein
VCMGEIKQPPGKHSGGHHWREPAHEH